MDDFLQRFARQLSEGSGTDVDLPQSSKNRLLAVARVIAHNSERKNAPLATFLIGRFVEDRVRAGAASEDALAEAISAAERLLPPEEGDDALT